MPTLTFEEASAAPPKKKITFEDAAPPPPKRTLGDMAGDVIGGVIPSVGDAIRETGHQYAASGRQLAADEKAFFTPPKSIKDFSRDPSFLNPGNIVNDIGGMAGSVITGPLTSILGRPVEQASGGKIKKEAVGNAAALAIPLAGEAGEAASLSRAAREAGVGRPGMAANLEARAKLAANRKAAAPPGPVRSAVNVVARPVGRAINVVSGNRFKPPHEVAAERLGEGLKAEGTSPAHLERQAQRAVAVGAEKPSLLDLAGTNVVSTAKAAALKSPRGRSAAEQGSLRSRANLAPNAAAAAAKLTPGETRTPQELREALVTAQDEEAKTNYAEPYAKTVTPEEADINFMDTPEGDKALNATISTAQHRAAQNLPNAEAEFSQLKALRQYFSDRATYAGDLAEWKASGKGTFKSPPSGTAKDMLSNPETAPAVKERLRKEYGWTPAPPPEPPKIPEMSGGALDRLRIGLRDRQRALTGDQFKEGENPSLGVPVGKAHKDLGSVLDDIPHLKEARDAYKLKQAQIDALDVGENILGETSANFVPEINKMPPEAKESARVAARQSIVEAFSRKPGEAISTLEAIQSRQVQDNLTALFGKNVAEEYAEQARFRLRSHRNQQAADPRIGSQTAPLSGDVRGLHAAHAALSPHTGWTTKLVNWLSNMNTITEPESRAIARLLRGDLSHFLQRALGKVHVAPDRPAIGRPASATAGALGAEREDPAAAP